MSKTLTSFYVTGGTLQREAPSYVERRADNDLYEGLTQGKFCYVLTSRQMGKSSLMVRTAVRLREKGVSVAVLDLTALGQNLTPEQWYDGLLSRMGRQLDLEDELEDFWLDHEKLGPLQRWMLAIEEVVLKRLDGRVVIFVDEIDAVRSLPFSTDEFFAGIREFYNRRTEDAELERLTFCLLGVASPTDLIRDTRTTPFNIGRRIELNDFNEKEAAPLTQGLGRTGELGATLLKRILYWTGGHPYLTQRLCQSVAEDRSVTNSAGVDRVCESLFLSSRAREQDDNLLFVRERMLRSEAEVASLLSLYEKVHSHKRVRDDETNPLVSVLRLSGITRVVEGRLNVRNRIYHRVFDREWVKDNMPDAELRRQKVAYRRGLLRAAAIAAMFLIIVGSLAVYAFAQRNRAEDQARKLTQALEEVQKQKAIAEERAIEVENQRNIADEKREEAEDQRGLAEEQRTEAEKQQKIAETQRQEAFTQKTIADERTTEAVSQRDRADQLTYTANIKLAYQAWDTANISTVLQSLTGQIPEPGQKDRRGFEWYYLWRLSHSDLATLKGHTLFVSTVAFSPDGRTLATGSGDNTVKLWDTASRQELATLKGHDRVVDSVAFSPDGKTLATGSGDNTVKLWEAATDEEV